ncbi:MULTISPECIES: relaxase/mobilization nuclease domain-containing protein [Lactobacillaceae]|uniref:relaxase/mobilization nuclease domain-containing protein n=1 Tax=Lactobacillaceae TaxID=33958 RepID=UPI0007E0E8EE|nr:MULTISPECIES: relaxase/mobilization nuclease domain-containing protein [Lactobacillaceae]MBU7491889.1 relaxase/mobilization nuclease domain-containing protein [Lactiplantibacillus pentosus]MBU7524407.1 relaxase/mobilization nuclease domain-containing protein [Lactiplantibacillus pentosus]OAU86191.1 relaxase [Lacticaseibacillus rhamnosus]PIN32834.1 relaxase [Lacticaseibacillus rhamnosus]PTS00258.1 relaxase [Lacticaseibacillus rhamnosus]
MATTHIKRSASASRLVNYAEKRAVLKDGLNLDVDYAKSQFKQVREVYGNQGKTQAYASRISFSPKEFDPTNEDDQQKALDIAKEVYQKTYPNQQVALYEHADTDALHIHAVVGAIDLETGKKMHGNWQEYREKLVHNTDEIVQKHGLEVTKVDPARYEKRSMAEIKMQDRGQTTWKDQIRQAVDSTMSNPLIRDFQTFRDDLKQKAIDVWERGKDLTYQLTGTNYKARGNKLGTAYEKGAIYNELERRTRDQRDTQSETRKPDTNRPDSTQSDHERNQELSGHANSTTKQATNRIDRTTETNRTSQSARQSSLSEDLERFKQQQRDQQRTISRDAKRRAKPLQRADKDRQSKDNSRTAKDKQRPTGQQQHVKNPKRQPKPDRSRDYGPSR